MAVRIATLDDAPGIMARWNDAVDANAFDFWEEATSQVIGYWTLRQTVGQIASDQFSYVDIVRRRVNGFFFGYQAPLPPVVGIRSKAERLVLWLVQGGIRRDAFEASLTRLFNFWFRAAYRRGYPSIWGTVPANSPPGGVHFLRNAKAGTDNVFSERPDTPEGLRPDPENDWPVFWTRLPITIQTVTP